jgi:hypothetical protein
MIKSQREGLSVVRNRPQLDASEARPRDLCSDLDGLIQILRLNNVVTAEPFLGLGKRPVGDQDLTVAYADCGRGIGGLLNCQKRSRSHLHETPSLRASMAATRPAKGTEGRKTDIPLHLVAPLDESALAEGKCTNFSSSHCRDIELLSACEK